MVAVVRLLVGAERRVAREYRAGASATELADRHHVSVSTICRVLDRAGVPRRSPGRSISPARGREDEIATAYQQGQTIEQIAARLGCSISPVRAALRRAGVETNGPGRRRRPVDAADIVERYSAGATLAELGVVYGVSSKVIADVLETRGIARRSPGRRPTKSSRPPQP
jgi:DNA-binding CsgD family transcriptional regulator